MAHWAVQKGQSKITAFGWSGSMSCCFSSIGGVTREGKKKRKKKKNKLVSHLTNALSLHWAWTNYVSTESLTGSRHQCSHTNVHINRCLTPPGLGVAVIYSSVVLLLLSSAASVARQSLPAWTLGLIPYLALLLEAVFEVILTNSFGWDGNHECPHLTCQGTEDYRGNPVT